MRSVTTLEASQGADVAMAGFILAALAFKRLGQQDDQEWLERRYSHMHDVIRETPVYDWILNEGIAKGLEQGKQQGLEQGKQQGLKQAIISVVQARFPVLVTTVKDSIVELHDSEVLQMLIVSVSIAANPEEIMQTLLKVQKGQAT